MKNCWYKNTYWFFYNNYVEFIKVWNRKLVSSPFLFILVHSRSKTSMCEISIPSKKNLFLKFTLPRSHCPFSPFHSHIHFNYLIKLFSTGGKIDVFLYKKENVQNVHSWNMALFHKTLSPNWHRKTVKIDIIVIIN